MITTLIGAVGLVAPAEVRAAVDITEVRVESVTATSFGVRVNSLGSGWSYRLYASTDKAMSTSPTSARVRTGRAWPRSRGSA